MYLAVAIIVMRHPRFVHLVRTTGLRNANVNYA